MNFGTVKDFPQFGNFSSNSAVFTYPEIDSTKTFVGKRPKILEADCYLGVYNAHFKLALIY